MSGLTSLLGASGRFDSDDLKPMRERWGRWFDLYCWESLPSGDFYYHAQCRLCDWHFQIDTCAEYAWRPATLPLPDYQTSAQILHAGKRYFDIRYRIIDGWPHDYVSVTVEAVEDAVVGHLIDHSQVVADDWATVPWEILQLVVQPVPALLADELVSGR